MIKIKSVASSNLTIKKLIGIIREDDWLRILEEFYLDRNVTKNIIFDLSSGLLGHLTSDNLRNIARSMGTYVNVGIGTRAAIVTPADLEYVICKVLTIYVELEEIPFDIRAFRTFSEAAKWIGVDSLPSINDM